MPVETEVEHIPLNKQRLLEFLEAQNAPVTAKAASVGLDTRASTVTEMLERCAAQGLVEREVNQRPREYRITDTGRRLLESPPRSGQGNSEPESAEAVETLVSPQADIATRVVPSVGSKKARLLQMLERVRGDEKEEGSEGEREQAGAVSLDELREELTLRFEGLCEDVGDLFEALSLRPTDSAERIKRTLESSAEQAKADAQSEALRNLYRTRYELRALGWFDSKDEVAARIAELEGMVGKAAAEQIEHLVSFEGEIRGDSDAEILRTVLELRDALHFPASVFGRRVKDTEAAE
jgi:DNA-binding MarR family transcriptional regulator